MFKLFKFIFKMIITLSTIIASVIGAFMLYDAYQRKTEESEDDYEDDENLEVITSKFDSESKN